MKLNFKRIISFVAAAAMALSSFSMLTVSAENEETVISPIVQTASVAAQVRASGVNENGEWTGMNSSSSKIVESGDLESTAKSNFGIFYYFDKIELPEDAIVTNVTITAYQGSSKFSGKPFVMLHTENPADKTKIADIFEVSKTAANVAFSSKSTTEEIAAITVGTTTMTELTEDSGTKTGERTESVKITGDNIAKFFNENDANSYFLYNKDRTDGNRKYSTKAEITVEYKKAEASLTHGETVTKYEKFEDAYTSAEDGDTIKLLNDVTTSKGMYVKNKNITINGNNKAINNGNYYIAFEGSTELTIKNLTINGSGNLEIKENTTINADNLTISHLQINGSTIESKGILKNSAVDALKCYGKLTLENTTVKNITFPNIRVGFADVPKITSNSDFQSESITIEKITSIGDDYTLFDGTYTPETVTIASDYVTLYKYENGLVKAIPQTTTENTPEIAIDYIAEKLTGFIDGGNYTINDVAVVPENGELAINSLWLGTTLKIVKKGDNSTTTDSEAQSLAIPVRPAAPEITGVDEATVNGNDGKITGVNNTMEYKLSSSGEWTDVTGTEITNLAPGEYQVRLKAVTDGDNKAFAGEVKAVTINAHGLQEPIVTVPAISDVTYTPNMKLSDIALTNPDGNTAGAITWKAPDTALNAGDNQKFAAVFTPDNTNDYKIKDIEIVVNIKKATPDVSWSDSEITVTYTDGMKLSDVTLPIVSGNTSGTLAWNEADAVLNIGTASYDVVFTPTDTTNYNTKTGSISVKVEEQVIPSYNIKVADEINGKLTVSKSAKVNEQVTVTVSDASYVANSLTVCYTSDNSTRAVPVTSNGNQLTFTMPATDVTLTALFDAEDTKTIIASNDYCYNVQAKTANKGHYIRNQSDSDEKNLALGFDLKGIDLTNKVVTLRLTKTGYSAYTSTVVNLIQSNPWNGGNFNYDAASNANINIVSKERGNNAQYAACEFVLNTNKINLSDSKLYMNVERAEQAEKQAGNDYFAIPSATVDDGKKAVNASYLPQLIIKTLPEKYAPEYALQTDTQDDMFQYHFAGGTTEYNNGTSETGKTYDTYLWVPSNTSPGELKGLVAVKMNLIEVPFVYSQMLRSELAKKNFGILFLVCQKDKYGYNNTLNGFYTKEDYNGNELITDTSKFTTDNKDAAQILDEILAGIAKVSGYSEIKDTTPIITIGHSAASGFGNKSANWNKNRVIAQIHMKNGMSGNEAMIPGVPTLQYAAQYTEHSNGADRDRSVRDARWHIEHERSEGGEYLVSHIIEWGSGHYDWSDNATYMLTKYITKAIEARLPADYDITGQLNDLTNTGYLMKPFEKNGTSEQEAGYYRDYLQGWLSSGQNNSSASEDDKKASFWFFDEEFANEVNKFTNYAIPESPDSKATGISGSTSSEIEPFILMKDPSKSTWSNTPATAPTLISPFTSFASNPFSRYGSNRFINYERMSSPDGNASNTASLGGYDTVTVDTYYMSKIPSITTKNTVAYDNAGDEAKYPMNTKAEFVPLIAPYEIVSSELLDMAGMTKDESNAEAENVASVTRTKLRFHNNRVYFRSGNQYTLEDGYNTMDSYGFIKSPEVRDENGFVTSSFKATSSQMNIPYVNKGTEQTLTLNKISDINIYGMTENPSFDVEYTSTDSDLQKYTDVFVEYGPAKAVRIVGDDGSYSWKIEILRDKIPENAKFPIEVNVVASNLGKWEKTYGATTSQSFNIISRSDEDLPEITDVTVTPSANLVYNGNEQVLATLSGTKQGDTVSYKIDGNATEELKGTDAKEYSLEITVSRENYKDYVWTGTVEIKKAQITGVTVTGGNAQYDGKSHDLITVSGITENDTVTYKVDDKNENTEKPTFTDIGTHSVKVTVSRGDNYVPYEQNVSVSISAEPTVTGITVTPYSGIYDKSEHDALTVEGLENSDIVTYIIDGKEVNDMPKITNAGNYPITLKVSRDGYAPYSQIYTAVISKANAEITAELNQSAEYDGKVKNVLASLNHDETELKYSITKNGESVSEIVETGEYIVVVSADETDNYNAPQAVTVTFTVTEQEQPIVKPEIIIGEDYSSSDTSSSVDITVKNPNDETNNGVLIAALYSEDGICLSVSSVKNGRASFNYEMDEGMFIKAFMWKSFTGEDAMKPILPCVSKTIRF